MVGFPHSYGKWPNNMGDLPIENGAFSMDVFVLLESKQEHPEEHQTYGFCTEVGFEFGICHYILEK